jgi:hypothetical protein
MKISKEKFIVFIVDRVRFNLIRVSEIIESFFIRLLFHLIKNFYFPGLLLA